MRVIDMHAHLWLNRTEKCKRKIMKTIEQYGIDEVFISTLSRVQPPEDEVTLLNDATLGFMREEPRHIKGYVYVSPEHKNALSVMRRGIEEQGMLGVKIWVSEPCDSPCVNPLAEKIIEYGVPLLIHATTKSHPNVPTESTSVNVRNLALRYPELKIIMAHIDGNCYRGAENVRDLKNVFVDFSGTTGRAGEVEYAVEHIGADRILFGTDLSECSFSIPYARLYEARVSDEVRRKILYENTVKLFDRR